MMDGHIVLKDVHKSFGPKQVLRGLSVSVKKGRSLVVIGGSGTGKSVMLKCILGIIRPDAGEITVVSYHPLFETERREAASRSVLDNFAAVEEEADSLLLRAVAARLVTEAGWIQKGEGRHWQDLLEIFVSDGVPTELVEATGIAASRIRDAIILMVPLIWLAADQRVTIDARLPRSMMLNGLPMFALDKHTRIGREAIRALVKFNSNIRECLNRYVAPDHTYDAAYMAAFYADAAPLARKLVWQGSEELERLGTEADLFKVGVAREGVIPLLEVFRDNLDHLNKLRAHTLCKRQGFTDVATALIADEEGRDDPSNSR